ncbi:MAG: hypothetical protein KAI47_15800, partial [Deltaproteobacteria bacterium]|nr:hypothetical protein [Deltaproteobacteria bacterium]
MARRPLGELLVNAGLLNRGELRSALAHQRRLGQPLTHAIVYLDLIDEHRLVEFLAHEFHLPLASDDHLHPEAPALAKLDPSFCQRHGCLPLRLDPAGSRLEVAFADPTASDLVELLQVKTRCVISPHIAGPTALDAAIRDAYLDADRPTPSPAASRRRVPTGPSVPSSEVPIAAPSDRAGPSDVPRETAPGSRAPKSKSRPNQGDSATAIAKLHQTIAT